MSTADIKLAAHRVELWLKEAAFPFWAEVGVDRQGPGFVEQLTLEGRPADVPFKRVRVQSRQVYCFCQAAELGWTGNPVGLAERGIDLLLTRAWSGPDRGWASTLRRSGDVMDATPDLYDTAFVLFALGWWHRVTGDNRVVTLACQTLDFLHAYMRHPSGRGYLHRLQGGLPYLQNPHMHLIEALIVLRDSTRHVRFAEEAEELLELFLSRFFDPESGTLAEAFDAHWSRLQGAQGLAIEPGHQYEWVWLLDQFTGRGRKMPPDIEAAMRGLFGFAVRFGQNATNGLVVDGVSADGMVVAPDHRLWPQAERLKGWIAMSDRTGIDAGPALWGGVSQIFSHYLDTRPAGTWIEYRDASLKPRVDKIPSSSFYHVVLAFAEVLRFSRGQTSAEC